MKTPMSPWCKVAVLGALIVISCAAIFLFLLSGGNYRRVWHEERLTSGRTIKVTSFNLVWGVEHDERDLRKDGFGMEYVSANPDADPGAREKEALEVFELVRPASELWGLKSAELSGFPTLTRKGRYDLYAFSRGPDGKWSVTVFPRKVFSTD